ncbi:MAG: RHS repeat-associated core domain-containing protein [Candidatus Cybelea sp.]
MALSEQPIGRHANSLGRTRDKRDYEPFGAVYDERTSDVHQPLRLPGQEAEEFSTSEGPNGASGRYYNGFRWYRPDYGRYTQPDPIGFSANPYNLYAYANNNPIVYEDPLGLACSPWTGALALSLIAAAVAAAFLFPEIDLGALFGYALDELADFALSAYAQWGATTAAAAALLAGPIASALENLAGDESGAMGTGLATEAGGIAEAAEEGGALANAAEGLAPPSPDFAVTSGGDVIPVPEGATGPFPTNGPGIQFNGGAGGNGLAANVTDVRIMEANAENPTGYVNYGSQQVNGGWQSVDPYSGQSIPPSNPWWHIPINVGP